MAKKKDLGALVLRLEADSKQLRSDLDRVSKKVTKTSKQMEMSIKGVSQAWGRLRKATGAAVAAYATLSGARGISAAVRANLAYLDSIDKVSEKVGVSNEFLQQSRFAAEQSGIAVRTLDMAMQRFGRRSGEAAEFTGEAIDALAKLGISLRDGNDEMRSTEALFRDAMVALSEIEDPLERLARGFKLFDSEGAGVVVMAEAFDELAAKAAAAGAVIDDETITRAVEAKDALHTLAQVMRVELAPALVDLADPLLRASRLFARFAKGTAQVWETLRDFFDLDPTNLSQIADREGEALVELAQAQAKLNAARESSGLIASAMEVDAARRIANLEAELILLAMQRQAIEEQQRARRPAVEVTPGGAGRGDTVQTKAQRKEASTREKAIRDLRTENAEMVRLVAAKREGEVAYREAETAIRVEQEARSAGIDLMSEEGRELETLIRQQALLERKLKKTGSVSEEVFGAAAEAGENFTDTVSNAISQMATQAEVDFARIGTAFYQQLVQTGIARLIGAIFNTISFSAGTIQSPGNVSPGGEIIAPMNPNHQMASATGPATGAVLSASRVMARQPGVQVQVINNTPAQVSVQDDSGERGSIRQLQVTVDGWVKDGIARGRYDQENLARYGTRVKGRTGGR